VTEYQLRRFVSSRIPPLQLPRSSQAWAAETQRLRKKILDVAYHGWPSEWINSKPRFEDAGTIPAGSGYRLRKFRYEVVPGFWSTALLYEPANLAGKLPAILNVNGHEPEGKSAEYIQKRCINQARQGIVSLNLEWIGMGELAFKENLHWYNSHLDLAGSNGLGLFLLAMRRGVDFLWDHANVDHARLGVTGLSGGGWQSGVLAGLDERIAVAVPNAGYLSALSLGGVEHLGDNEQSSAGFLAVADNAHIAAMRAPKPTLLIYNAEDNCCFRAARIKPFLYDRVLPFYNLFNAREKFVWYENTDPGDHNYQHDNRMQSYNFFAKHFRLPAVNEESPASADIKTRAELNVGLPPGALTVFGLAKKLASQIHRDPSASREKLAAVVHYLPVALEQAWPIANYNRRGFTSVSYRFDFNNGLSASGVWLNTAVAPASAPVTILLDDNGRSATRVMASDRINRGEHVLAADLLFTGDAIPTQPSYPTFDRMLVSLGQPSVGLRAAQLNAMAKWARNQGASRVRLESSGIRSQITALVAAALEPALWPEVQTRDGLRSLGEVYERGLEYLNYPELFCLDLYKEFDLDRIRSLGPSPARSQ
jgi:hypothetical protein